MQESLSSSYWKLSNALTVDDETQRQGYANRKFQAGNRKPALYGDPAVDMRLGTGMSHEDIVLGFHPPEVRQYTEFAAA